MLGAATAVAVSYAPAEAAAPAPSIYPRPHQISVSRGAVVLPPTVTVVRGAATDPAALTALTVALQGAGVRVQVTDRPESGPLTVYLGGATENPATADVLATLSAGNTEGLPAEGYVLATGSSHGRQLVALAGVDPTGTFYAVVQSFRQLLSAAARSRLLPVVHVRDWPAAQVRGTIEGFYGTPCRTPPGWTSSIFTASTR
ncbi:glycoside hydrolase family 20 zincin-like fold domain-containing protein [Fodinicola feengrottensis]|uniref:glycoside hydrolase family 20 zincin-like fold domain-containing protein n=1 Tax=Fodinicola feengrottensis TaxID=435914 RepID=UPI002441E534|nr:glycoside hydrolase family 20 zincin-like fold domain-containing protein [Fodinicola feengrottensis]